MNHEFYHFLFLIVFLPCLILHQEDHGKPLFGVAFNYHLPADQPQMFAAVGSNRITVYECRQSGYMKAIQAYVDSDVST